LLSSVQTLKIDLFLMGNDSLSGKQIGSQATCRVTRWLSWIQSVCIFLHTPFNLEERFQIHIYFASLSVIYWWLGPKQW